MDDDVWTLAIAGSYRDSMLDYVSFHSETEARAKYLSSSCIGNMHKSRV